MRHACPLNGQGDHKVSLDQVIQTMYETGWAIQTWYKRRLSPASPSMWLSVRAEKPKSRKAEKPQDLAGALRDRPTEVSLSRTGIGEDSDFATDAFTAQALGRKPRQH